KNLQTLFKDLYKNFNDRNIELVINKMAPDVQWANGMNGGYVYGQEAVKEYWTEQFKVLNSKVTPLEIKSEDEAVHIKVHQVVHDLYGGLVADQMVEHIFYLKNNRIYKFE